MAYKEQQRQESKKEQFESEIAELEKNQDFLESIDRLMEHPDLIKVLNILKEDNESKKKELVSLSDSLLSTDDAEEKERGKVKICKRLYTEIYALHQFLAVFTDIKSNIEKNKVMLEERREQLRKATEVTGGV